MAVAQFSWELKLSYFQGSGHQLRSSELMRIHLHLAAALRHVLFHFLNVYP